VRSDFVRPGQRRWFHLDAVEQRIGKRTGQALFAFANGLLSLGILSTLAWLTHHPLLFPSLGPTAFLLFYNPLLPAASPRNALLGHLVGVLCGYGSLALFGLTDAAPALVTGVDLPRVGAASLSLAATSGLMVLLAVEHPPAGATTLIVSLGLIRRPDQLVTLMIAVALLCVQGWVINRLAGIPYPTWCRRPDAGPGSP
jgi:CBS domain-containing membrane protein